MCPTGCTVLPPEELNRGGEFSRGGLRLGQAAALQVSKLCPQLRRDGIAVILRQMDALKTVIYDDIRLRFRRSTDGGYPLWEL